MHLEALNILPIIWTVEDKTINSVEDFPTVPSLILEATLVNGMLGERGTVLAPVIGSHNLAGVWRE